MQGRKEAPGAIIPGVFEDVRRVLSVFDAQAASLFFLKGPALTFGCAALVQIAAHSSHEMPPLVSAPSGGFILMIVGGMAVGDRLLAETAIRPYGGGDRCSNCAARIASRSYSAAVASIWAFVSGTIN